jgi:8-oxo-dGTP diphosphatase
MAAGTIVLRDDRVLMVRPTYKGHWDVPGGYLEPGESPLAACRREVLEELGLDAGPLTLASIDWAPETPEAPGSEAPEERLLFLFAAPALAAVDPAALGFPDGELSAARFVRLAELPGYTVPRLARRLAATARALATGSAPVYLEHGHPPGPAAGGAP